jgi:uncharacterized protein YcbK (DUF882 family)
VSVSVLTIVPYLRYFKVSEFDSFDRMDLDFLNMLDAFREFVGKPIILHSDYRSNSDRHITGKAVDMHIVGMNCLDQLLIAERFGKFKGIGIYPSWNSPGLHIDTAKNGRWLAYDSNGRQEYTSLTAENIKRYVISTI